MIIYLSPQRSNFVLSIEREGEVLFFNGDTVDMSSVTDVPLDGVTLSPFLTGTVSRVGGQLRLTVILPLSEDASEEGRFPSPIVDPPDGLVELPS